MGWVVNTIAKLILRAICQLFAALAEDFIKLFGINIGGNFPSITSKKDISLIDVLSNYPKSSGLSSVFDQMFPVVQFKQLLVGMAVTIATGLLVIELVKAIAAPMTHGKKQIPAVSVLKYALAIPGVFLSYRIFLCMEYIGNEFYIAFGKVAMDLKATGAAMSSGTDTIWEHTFNILYGAGEVADFFVGTWALKGLAATLMNLFIVWLLFTNFMKLIVEIMERYVVMGVLFYTAPLPFATLASDDTSHIFWTWLKMALSQMLLIITNGMFVYVFIAGLIQATTKGKGFIGFAQGALETSTVKGRIAWIIYMLLLVGWLLFAQRFDGYLKSLGLATAQTGNGLASAVRGGVLAVGGTAAALSRSWKNSDARSNMREKPFGFNTKSMEAAKDIKNEAMNKVAGAMGMDNTPYKKALESANNATRLSQNMKEGGLFDEAKSWATNHSLLGDQAKDVLAHMSEGNKALQDMIGKGSDFKLDTDKDGSITGSWKNEDGKEMGIHFGDKEKGSSMGKLAGVDSSITGDQLSLDKVLSNGKGSATRQAAQDYANERGSSYIPGTLKDGSYAVKNKATGQVAQIAPNGSSDMMNKMDLGTGFATGTVDPAMAKGFESFDHKDNVEKAQSQYFSKAENKGYDIPSIANGGNMPISEFSDFAELTNIDPGIRSAFENATSREVKDGVITARSSGGAQMSLSLFDRDADGVSLQNSAGMPLHLSGESLGNDNGRALFSATPGVQKEARQFAKYLSNVAGLDVVAGKSGSEPFVPIMAVVKDSKGNIIDQQTIGRATNTAVSPMLGGDWLNNGNYSFQLNDDGQKWFRENGLGNWDSSILDSDEWISGMNDNEMLE